MIDETELPIAEDGDYDLDCPACNGNGMIMNDREEVFIVCTSCGGSGFVEPPEIEEEE